MATEAPPALPARREDVDLVARKPIIDNMDPRYLELIQKSRFKGLTTIETGYALELAAHYQLDPFAEEIWATRSEGRDGKEGQLLIMVGRDGLRKVVMRNGLEMDGDVVRQKDAFVVTRAADRTRTVEHRWEGGAEERGPIIGAWAETWDTRTGKQRGFFFAPMKEYVPKSEKKLQYSPWGSQESVMILAAAERQSARQATPLSGLLMEGEMDLNDERAIDASTAEDDAAVQAVIDSVDAPEGLRDRLYEAVVEGNRLAPNSYPAMKVQMLVADKDEEGLLAEVEEMERLNAEHRERRARREEAEAEAAAEESEVTDAEVVEEPTEGGVTEKEARAEVLRHAIADLEAALDEEGLGELERSEYQEKLKAAAKELDELTGPVEE